MKCTHCQNTATFATGTGTMSEESPIIVIIKLAALCDEHHEKIMKGAPANTLIYAPVGHIRALQVVADGEIEVKVGRRDGERKLCSVVGCVEGPGRYALQRKGVIYPVCVSCAVAAEIVATERENPRLRPALYAEAKAQANKIRAEVRENRDLYNQTFGQPETSTVKVGADGQLVHNPLAEGLAKACAATPTSATAPEAKPAEASPRLPRLNGKKARKAAEAAAKAAAAAPTAPIAVEAATTSPVAN
jgi:hypothetical protein